MNRLENWFCASSLWRNVTRERLLPWLLSGVELGDHVLEIGAGPGAATEELRRRAARVTSLEYSHDFAASLARRDNSRDSRHDPTGSKSSDAPVNAAVLQGDASTLPFPEKTFSAAIAVLVLHHLRSPESQEHAFAEIFRVLRPGGVFLAVDIPDGWFHRMMHIGSTFVPVSPATAPARLEAAGFPSVDIVFRHGAFRLRALRPQGSDEWRV
jgi:SAM-dependent methyltransferase